MRSGKQMLNSVLTANTVKQDFDRRLRVFTSENLPVICEHLLRHPKCFAAQR